MRIVHVVDYLMPDMGYQEFLLAQYNELDGHDVYIITSNKYYPVPNYNDTWFKILGPRDKIVKNYTYKKIKIIQKKCLFEFKRRPWIKDLEESLIQLKPDIIMVHGTFSFSAIRAARIKKKMKTKLLLDNHMILAVADNSLIGKICYFLFKKLIRPFLEKNAERIIGVTRETCLFLNKFEGFKKKVSLLPLGVDLKTFYPINLKKNKEITIIQTGKLNSDKKPQWLALAVISLLKEKKYKLKLIYIGNGENKIIEDIKSKFRHNNFSSHLKFVNYVNLKKLNYYYNKCSICVFPEGTSLSSLQVAACKKPVIMANHPASLEKARLGIGTVYKRGDINDLKNKIKKLIDNKNFYDSVCKNSYNAVLNNFGYETISKKMIKFSK